MGCVSVYMTGVNLQLERLGAEPELILANLHRQVLFHTGLSAEEELHKEQKGLK